MARATSSAGISNHDDDIMIEDRCAFNLNSGVQRQRRAHGEKETNSVGHSPRRQTCQQARSGETIAPRRPQMLPSGPCSISVTRILPTANPTQAPRWQRPPVPWTMPRLPRYGESCKTNCLDWIAERRTCAVRFKRTPRTRIPHGVDQSPLRRPVRCREARARTVLLDGGA